MIGADTNVLLRLVLNDDPVQTGQARERVERARREREPIFVNPICLMEFVWTLRRARKASREDIDLAVTGLMETPPFALFDEVAVGRALDLFRERKADFADCMIAVINDGRGCGRTLTFDARALEIDHFVSPAE